MIGVGKASPATDGDKTGVAVLGKDHGNERYGTASALQVAVAYGRPKRVL
jgi:hypothetical protein